MHFDLFSTYVAQTLKGKFTHSPCDIMTYSLSHQESKQHYTLILYVVMENWRDNMSDYTILYTIYSIYGRNVGYKIQKSFTVMSYVL